jgi:ribosomal protein S18 acetylase RimI-like enzyme
LFLQLANRLSDFPVPPWRVPEHINRADHAIMLADLHAPHPDNLFLVAERLLQVGGVQRAGFMFASSREDYFTGQRHAHVETLAVAVGHEGSGVAKCLLAACEKWSRERGDEFVTLNVWMQNTKARSVYGVLALKPLLLRCIECSFSCRYERLGWQPETVHYRKALK